MQRENYFFIEWSARPGQPSGVLSSAICIGVEPGSQEALTREADECIGGYAQRICSFKGTLVLAVFFFFSFLNILIT